jgi:multimeric flavodoxin WrbA
MKVLVVQGSPRKNGNTDMILSAILESLKGKCECNLETVRVEELDIAGCNECFACQKAAKPPKCSICDDMTPLYRKIMKADLTIFATPVFCWGVPAQIKAVFDRLYACFQFEPDGHNCVLSGKRFAFVVTAGGGKNDGADLCVSMYKRFIEFSGADNVGVFQAVLLGEPKETRANTKLLSRAKGFAARLVA